MQTADADGDWAELVTDGHVRAARLRFMQPWLIATGIIVLLVGFYLWAGVNVPADQHASSTAKSEVDEARRPVELALQDFASLSAINVPADAAQALPNVSEIGSALVPMILTALIKTGRLPTENLEVRTRSPIDFWHKPWPNGTLVVTGTDKLKLVGGIINTNAAGSYPSPARWLGIFSKREGTWKYATAQGEAFADVAGQPKVSLTDIPLTLAPVIPQNCLDAMAPTPDCIPTLSGGR